MLGFFRQVWGQYRALARQDAIERRQALDGSALPEIINLNANDICNSRCTMCNIWQQKKDIELSPEEFGRVLSDPLFAKVRHVGITGGEPTLREDLPELYQACIDALPSLVGLSIITNAIRERDVIDRIGRVHEVCRRAGKSFSVMVSLDGYGAMHDHIRGREGNFETATRVIAWAKTLEGVPVSTGSTLSKDNLYDADRLLAWMRREGVYGRFRLAEFIKRLYNEDRGEVIRNYTDEERYHLEVFFHKLEVTFEQNPEYQRTYRNIRAMLGGAPRQMGCPYHALGVVVDGRGDLAYCAPKSEKIGNGLAAPGPMGHHQGRLDERRRILADDCHQCVHDYHHRQNAHQYLDETIEGMLKNLMRLDFRYSRKKRMLIQALYTGAPLWARLARMPGRLPGGPAHAPQAPTPRPGRMRPGGPAPYLVVGWYGTETVGDKAILAGIIADVRATDPGARFVVASLNPYVTHRTLEELSAGPAGQDGALDFEIVGVYEWGFFEALRQARCVIMGGGPLMDVDELSIVLIAARLVRNAGKPFWIYGCGIGPLNEPDMRTAVEELCRIADRGLYRDRKSAAQALAWGAPTAEVSGDPSRIHLRALLPHLRPVMERTDAEAATGRPGQVSFFLRALPREYQRGLSEAEFDALRRDLDGKLAGLIRHVHGQGHKVNLCSMHTHFIGGDDRDYYRELIDEHLPDLAAVIHVDPRPSSVDQITGFMATSRLSVVMRFHSVVFAHTLGRPFLALDYTAGGKIHNFLDDEGALAHYHPLSTSLEDLVGSLEGVGV